MNLKTLHGRMDDLLPDWAVCKHITPKQIVKSFSDFVLRVIPECLVNQDEVSIVDLFCGDGRLGIQTSNSISDRLNSYVDVTYLDIHRPESLFQNASVGKSRLLVQDAYKWVPDKLYDIVLANPPYLRMNKLKAESLGFDWNTIRLYSSNLYALGIIKAISVCKETGVVCVIAPYSWLTNRSDVGFKKYVLEHTKSIIVSAFQHRGIFDNVNQDIAFQCFQVNNKNEVRPKISFSYHGTPINDYSLGQKVTSCSSSLCIKNVSIGSIVWNREGNKLSSTKKGTTPLIHGKNITHNDEIAFDNVGTLEDKQYVKAEYSKSVKHYYSPLIAVRRVMGGKPGNWKVYAAYYCGLKQLCAENHVIIIELGEPVEHPQMTIDWIKETIAHYYSCSGSPNISVTAIKTILSK